MYWVFKKKQLNYTSLWSPKLQQFFEIHVSYISNCLSQKQVWLNRKLMVWYLNTDIHANTQSCSQDVINTCISKNYSRKKMTQNSWYIYNRNHCLNMIKWTWIYIWQGLSSRDQLTQIYICCKYSHKLCVNLFLPSDAIKCDKNLSTLVQIMAWCLMVPSHYLNQCRLIIRIFTWRQLHRNYWRCLSLIWVWILPF